VKRKIKSILIIFFDVKWTVNKEFVLAGQTINSAYYYDVLRQLHENVQTFRPKIFRQKNWLLHHDNAPSHTTFFTKEFLSKNNITAVFHTPCFFLFPQVKIKLKGRQFDATEVIEAESQGMLNTLSKRDFQDAF
jgi:hypothetical protein